MNKESIDIKILFCLDRDGFIIKDKGGFPGKNWPNETFELMPYVEQGIRVLREIPNSKIVMVTNQSGPARRLVNEDHIPAINKHILDMLPVTVDGVYYCPHVKEDYAQKHEIKEPEYSKYVSNCDCRKPKTGMLEAASKEHFGVPLNGLTLVYMLGDRKSDVQTGLNVGRNGKGGFVPSEVAEHSHLDEVEALQRSYGTERVFIGKTFVDLAVQICSDVQWELKRLKL